MFHRNIWGFVLVPAVLVFTALIIKTLQLWSNIANHTLPWLCTAVAIAILLLGGVCLVLQSLPHAIPGWIATTVVGVVLLIFGIGLFVDWVSYSVPADVWASAAEWTGFAVILIGVFSLPHFQIDSSKKAAPDDLNSDR